MPMPGRLRFLADARHFQIASLAILLAINFLYIDFGAKPPASALAIAASLVMQAACAWWFGLKQLDLRSPLITGLSLSLLLRADAASLHALAGVIAILSKFVIRRDDKHVFNPAGFAIVALLLLSPDHVWISPGQWGTSIWFASLVAFCAILVLHAARRADIAIFFLASHAGLLLARALWLGLSFDPRNDGPRLRLLLRPGCRARDPQHHSRPNCGPHGDDSSGSPPLRRLMPSMDTGGEFTFFPASSLREDQGQRE